MTYLQWPSRDKMCGWWAGAGQAELRPRLLVTRTGFPRGGLDQDSTIHCTALLVCRLLASPALQVLSPRPPFLHSHSVAPHQL